ncbi:MAG: hypothetical protein R3E77_14700 [Steroidobacteraceae bacterium]
MKALTGPKPTSRRPMLLVAVALTALVLYINAPDDDTTVSAAPDRPARSMPRTARARDSAATRLELPERKSAAASLLNLFANHSWYVAPPPPPPVVVKPAKPTAPPLPYELMGSYEQAGQPTVYFLVKGDRVFDVRDGQTLETNYRIDGVQNGRLAITYLPLDEKQWLNIGR